MLVYTQTPPQQSHEFAGVDLSSQVLPREKADALSIKVLSRHRQKAQLKNPNIKITLEALTDAPPLEQVAIISEGLHTGDYPRFGRNFWEIPKILGGWSPQQGGGSTGEFCSGFEDVLKLSVHDKDVIVGAYPKKGVAWYVS